MNFAHSAEWHLYDLDAGGELAHLLRLTEADYRDSSFLDERAAIPGRQTRTVSVEELEDGLHRVAHTLPPLQMIFHLGHCGSTLLSRALAATTAVLPLREPLTLRKLVALFLAEGRPVRFADRLDPALTAHARVFRPQQRAMLKATSTCNPLLIPILQARPESRALLIYVSLETYLAGMLGKLTPASDLTGHSTIRLADWKTIPGASAVAESPGNVHDPVRLAVLAWLTGMRHLLAAVAEFPSRTRLLDFEVFLADPEARLSTAAEFFGLGHEVPAILEAWPGVSTGYSKQPEQAYSAFNRRKTLQRGRMTRSAEILAGLNWAETLTAGVDALQPCGDYLR